MTTRLLWSFGFSAITLMCCSHDSSRPKGAPASPGDRGSDVADASGSGDASGSSADGGSGPNGGSGPDDGPVAGDVVGSVAPATKNFRDCQQDVATLASFEARAAVLRRFPGFHYYGSSTKIIGEMWDAGFKVFHVDTNALGSDGFSKPINPAPGQFDFSEIDERVERILQGAPGGCLVVRIETGVPDWWKAAHPEELDRTADGNTDHQPVLGEPVRAPSPASALYLADVKAGMGKLLEHIAGKPWAPRVLGFILQGLFSQESYHYDSGFDLFPGRVPKFYSQPTRAAFRKYLRVRYESDAALRNAWGRSDVALADADFPPPGAFNKHLTDASLGSFRSLPAERAVVDTLAFRSAMIADLLDGMAGAIKASPVGGDRVVGALYGYVNEFSGNPSYGHNALGRLLRSKNVDLILNEASYQQREAITGFDLERGPMTSVLTAGKIMMIDNDQGTYVSRQRLAELCEHYRVHAPELYNGGSMCTRPDVQEMWYRDRGLTGLTTADVSDGLLRRFAGFALSKGISFNVFSVWPAADKSDFSDPALLAALKRVTAVVAKAPPYVHKPAEILVVTDEDSNNFALGNAAGSDPTMLRLNITLPLRSFPRVGAPYDHVLMSGLAALDLSSYKMIVFLNAYHVTNATREMIRTKVKASGRLVVFAGGAGWLNSDYANPNQPPGDLVGFQIAHDAVKSLRAPIIRLGSYGAADALAAQLLRDNGAGTLSTPTAPGCCDFFYASDPRAAILAQDGNGGTTMAALKAGGVTTVWAATANLSAGIYRSLARAAGAHIYHESDDPFYHGPTTFTVYSSTDAAHVVRFPEATDVYDLETDAPLGKALKSMTVNLKRGEAGLYRWEKSK